jgi:hypothetical protein
MSLVGYATTNSCQAFEDKESTGSTESAEMTGLEAEWAFCGYGAADPRTVVGTFTTNGDDDTSDDDSDASLPHAGRMRFDYEVGVDAWVRVALDMPPAPWDNVSEADSDSSNAMTEYPPEDEDKDEDEGGMHLDAMPIIYEKSDIEGLAREDDDEGGVNLDVDTMSVTYDESDIKGVAREVDEEHLETVLIIKRPGEMYKKNEMSYEFSFEKRI